MEPILIYDTTLRDGTQGEDINFSSTEKVKIAKKLDELGIHYIEGGWPGSNHRDVRFFELAKMEKFENARITAFGATRKPGITAGDDPNLNALIESQTEAVAIFGKSWGLHVEQIMSNTRQENLDMIRESVAFLKTHDKEVLYDAEHFFDGYKDDADYAIETLMAAVDGGADFLVLCDTNGGTLTSEIESMTTAVRSRLSDRGLSPRLGIHCHNDCGVAVANSIAAIQAGAVMVQGTVNGYGERCGNADMTTIIPILSLKMNRPAFPPGKIAKLKSLSRYISETANMIPLNSRPFVGRSAFAHKGGIHVSAIMKETRAYEHMDPALVGNTRRVLVSDLAGKSNVEYKAKEMGVDLGQRQRQPAKSLPHQIRWKTKATSSTWPTAPSKSCSKNSPNSSSPLFDLESFRVTIEKDKDLPCTSHATIKIRVGDTHEITAAEGLGPVSALDNALRKALGKFYPDLDAMQPGGLQGPGGRRPRRHGSQGRVFIESRDQDQIWSTIGVSEDIIEASWQALADSFQFKLAKEEPLGLKQP
jgi:2-isopropylmalate synthase